MTSNDTDHRRSRRIAPACAVAVLLFLPPLSCAWSPETDQSQFAPLSELARSRQAVVRLYSAPIPGLEAIATHPWFVVKAAGATRFDRWELLSDAGGPYGHVRKNRMAPESGVGAGGVFIVGELIGAEAEPVVEFIEAQSPTYTCRDTYFFLGPNSNTYAQWILDQTGWRLTMPASAIGAGASPDCP